MSCSYCGDGLELCERNDCYVCEGCYANCDCDDCDSQDGCIIFESNNEEVEDIQVIALAKSILVEINLSKGMDSQKLDAIKQKCLDAVGGHYE